MSHTSPVPGILIIHRIICRRCGQQWAGEEVDLAGIRISRDTGDTACVCSDPSDPHYEDWVADRA